MKYQLVFIDEYLTDPTIKKFILSSQTVDKNKIIRQLQYLQEFGLNRANPNLRKISKTELWESRILGKSNIRIICFQLSNYQILILHIFYKKTNKTLTREIYLALKRLKLVLD